MIIHFECKSYHFTYIYLSFILLTFSAFPTNVFAQCDAGETTVLFSFDGTAAGNGAGGGGTGNIQTWTVPTDVTSVTITAIGAPGGNNANFLGGCGASNKGTFTVVPGTTLYILVGGAGGDATNSEACGGGGGSFVSDGPLATGTLLIAGSGGGGAAGSSGGIAIASAGFTGLGGSGFIGGGGAGFMGDGDDGTFGSTCGGGGVAITTSGNGGSDSCAGSGGGGYGGGGSGGQDGSFFGGGGGGGYDGGGGGGLAGGSGGRSWNTGSNPLNISGINCNGDGEVLICYIDCSTDADGDTFSDCVDCDDNDNTVYPGAPELCDGLDNNCDTQVDEGELLSAAISNILCDDNGTPSDPSDDTFTFEVTVTGSGSINSWTATDPNSTTGMYNTGTVFGPYNISDGDLSFVISDDDHGCSTSLDITAPATCSDMCTISASNTTPVCDDNGTPSDPSDDTYTFDVTVMGSNTAASWTANDPNGTTGAYNTSVSFGPYNISDGDISFTITDDVDGSCTTSILSITVPMTCSDMCDISATNTAPVCDDNGTPSDPSDDTYTFDVTVMGTNTAASWTANDPNSTTGSYNTSVTFGPYNISDGDISFTITDDVDGSCTTSILNITVPMTCSDMCDISATNTAPVCDDNGTPSDPSDDTYTFDVTVMGSNTAASWTANDPNGTTGAYNTSVTFGPYNISDGDISFTITDDVDGSCTTSILSITVPMTCSDLCDISASSTSPVCNDNGTPSDPSDDTYTFDVTVMGSNTAASWTANDPNGTVGGYNTSVSFGPYNISDGDISFTITDDVDGSCTTSILSITVPMTCSDLCDISASSTSPVCNDNGTPSDPSDDTYTFDVTVMGSNTAASWTANDPNSTTGAYNTSVTLGPYNVSDGDISFTITDDIDGSCTTSILSITVPMTCSDLCDINTSSTSPVCDDNGTPSDPSDDVFSFDVTVMGSNTGLDWTATDPNSTTGSYNAATSFGPYNISGGDLNFSVIDNVDGGCTDNVNIIAPATCSDQCDISAIVANVLCNSNGTPSDDTDDTYTFEVTVTGSNTGTGWAANDPNSTAGGYNASTTFGPYNISDGDLAITITDDVDGSCTTLINVTAPLTCSNTCSISNAVSNILCNDNGTPSDPSDDTYTFEVVVTGLNISAGWTADDANTESGFYGISNEFGPFAISGGTISFTITDDADPACTTLVMVNPPMTCSDQCAISATNATPICNDNGTPSDPTDDTYTFGVTVMGSNTGSSWTANDPNSTSGSYGVVTTFGPYNISDGDLNFTITDGTDSGCTESMMIAAPATCSDMCDISASSTPPICNDNGTPSDPSDDTYTFEVTATGSNTAASWTANDPNNTTGGYNTSVTFGPYNISDGDISFTITDDVDGSCMASVLNITVPMTCSDACDINSTSTAPVCDDSGTPSDPSDDTFTFDLTVMGSNTGSSWTATDPNSTAGLYNVATSFGPYDISGGDLTFSVVDNLDPGCTDNVNIIAPATCSDACDISAIFSNVQCNSNGTPSDDTDDTYTFEVTVTGSNTGSGWSASDPNSTTGGYNTSVIFGPYNISDGDLAITITDGVDGSCTTLINVVAPSTCSNTCSISNSISNILCNDNGTPSDPSDDTYTFEVVVTGLNISTGWTADDANTESGFYGISNEFGPFDISGGTISFTITDDADPACTTIVTVNPPMACSDQCAISATNTTPICNDNGTPSDPSDDTYTFDVTVMGSNTASSWTANDPNGTSGSYGTTTTFGPYNISDGDINFTITDGADSGCTESMMIAAPATCSDMCDITASNTTPICDDNGTPSDPSDDTYTFDVTVTGSNTGSFWTADDPNGNAGFYDTATTFGPYNISDGDISFTITDDVDGGCTTLILNIIVPMPCSDMCDISANSTSPVCNDNGTPSDPSDDVFSFDLTITGNNTGSGWTATDPNSTAGSYNATTSLGPYSISGGDLTFSVIDNIDGSCTDNVNITAPATCSDECDISAIFTNVQCNSNGTPSDDTDDTYTFEVTVTGSNTGSDWAANDPNGTTGGYNTSVTFGPYNISDGDLVITITDDVDGSCTTLINVVAPSTCSSTCSISNSVSNILCNDNGTPSDPSDDTYTFEVVVTGLNVSTGWTADDANGESGFYGISNEFGPFAISGGTISFTITDDADPGCTTIVTVSPPMTCSDQCAISATNTTPACDDNGTPSDPSDDTYTFDVTVMGSNTGSSWTANDPNGTSGSYSTSTTFGPYNISDGDINFTITDGTDSGCTESIMIAAPATCSDMCDISANSTSPVCDDNGTPSDPSDDTYTFDVTVMGSNTGASWTANDPNGTFGGYDVSITFGPYNISDGDISFMIIDDADGSCTTSILNVTVPMPCSNMCDINSGSTSSVCDDNGTPSDPSDDVFSFDLTVMGSNTGSGWTATDPNSTAGSYNIATSFGPYNISGGDLTFSVIDNADGSCTDNVNIIAPATCSDQCDISAIFTNVQCNSNGTPSDDTDDTYTFEVTVTGSNTGSGWSASDPNGTIGGYNTSVTFGPYNILDGDLVITITDDVDGSCTTLINVVAPSTCSNTCSISNSISNILCNDNGTPSDPNDDTYTFEVVVTGLNISTGWTADDANTESGFYGISNEFGPFAISGGTISFTITDDADPGCTTIVTVSPPMTCSDQCAISATNTTPICDDNGTPSDPSDDTYTFDVTVMGSNTGSSWTANDPNGTSGSYSTSTTFGPYNISDGDISFMITDGTDSGCTESIMIIAPATCSDMCDISASNTLPVCDDNGTPSDPSDDTYTFDVTVMGSNTGANWTASDPNITTGDYNTSVTFGPYNISDGDISFTITDDVDGGCTTSILNITVPMPCSNMCDISSDSTSPVCDDNGTPSDPSDDVFSFDLTVMGSNTGSGWTATDPNSTAGSYNVATSFGPYNISGGDLIFSVIDNADASCTDNVNIIAPASCSDACDISATISNILCNDNGTSSNPDDDTYTFEILVMGTNTGLTWQLSDPNSTTGNYNELIIVGPLNIVDGNLSLSVSDSDNMDCSDNFIVQVPSTCSGTCSISNSIFNYLCDDNGTPSDPDDDTFTFDVTIGGSNTGASWINDLLDSGNYNETTTLGPFPINEGSFNLVFEDIDDPSCTTVAEIIPPQSCSEECQITATLESPVCDDNGTPSNPDDDIYFVNILVSGTNTGTTWTSNDNNNTSGSYGSSLLFGPFTIADGGEAFTISDVNDPSCNLLVEFDAPTSCSNECEINVVINETLCQNNNTESDPSDDTFTIEIEVNGNNTSTVWESNDVNGSTGSYGTPLVLGPYNISDGPFTLIISDENNQNCMASISVEPPNTCSDLCELEVDVSNINCFDNNTPSISEDDVFSFDLLVSGLNTSNSWTANDPNNSTGNYNAITTISNIPISGGDLSFVVTDENDPLCNTEITILAPETCSDACFIEFTSSNILCNDNGTPADSDDDTYTFDLTVIGNNNSAGWVANDQNNTTGLYDVPVSFGPFLIANGNLNITISDEEDESCETSGIIQTPMTCSGTCSLASTISNINCNDNNTPFDPTDDIYFFDALIIGSNTSDDGWMDNFGNSGQYGEVSTLGPFQISAGTFNIVFSDLSDEDCITVNSIVPPGTCSDDCQISANIIDIYCDDNGTDSNSLDDIFFAEIELTGVNNSSSWTATDPNNSSGGYGTVLLGPYQITDSDQSFQVIDAIDPSCLTDVTLEAPNACSFGLCNIEVEILIYNCQNMNTVGDNSDDEIFMDIIVNSNSGGSGWIINSPSPFQGSYGVQTTIGPFGYSGDISFSITDSENSSCNSTFQINTSEIVTNVTTESMVLYCEFENALPLEAVGSNLIWFDSFGMEINSAPTPNTTILGMQTYSVLQSINGCESDLTEIIVEVDATPDPPMTSDVNYCIGDEATPLTAIGDNLMWFNSDFELLADAPIPPTDVEETMEYFVTSTNNNCESEGSSIIVSIVPCGCENPIIIESINSDREAYCLGQTINLSVNLIPSETSGTWQVDLEDSGEFSNINTQNTQFVTEEIGTYLFKFVTVDPDGPDGECISVMDSVIVEIEQANILVDFDVEDSGCDQEFGSITVNSISGGTPIYNTSVNGQEFTDFAMLDPGDHQLAIVDSEGCVANFDFSIFDLPNPSSEVSAGSDTCVILGQSILLLASGGVSYEWEDNGTFVNGTSGATPEVQPLEETTYSVTIIDENGCSHEDQVSVCIIEDPVSQMKPISLITPNGDGKNDVLLFTGLEAFPNNRLIIYNRWGSVIFDKRGYQINNTVFDGSRGGGTLPADTYYYILEIDGQVVIKSDLTIMKN